MWWIDDRPIAEYAECLGCKFRKDMKGGECPMYNYMGEGACIEGRKKDESLQSDGRMQKSV